MNLRPSLMLRRFCGHEMDQVREIMAARLKLLRSSKGMKQADLAEAAGVEINTISRYERGQQMPGVQHLLNISKALGVSPMDILPPADSQVQRLHILRQELSEKTLLIMSPKNLEDLIVAADACIQMEKAK